MRYPLLVQDKTVEVHVINQVEMQSYWQPGNAAPYNRKYYFDILGLQYMVDWALLSLMYSHNKQIMFTFVILPAWSPKKM